MIPSLHIPNIEVNGYRRHRILRGTKWDPMHQHLSVSQSIVIVSDNIVMAILRVPLGISHYAVLLS